jgi:arsenite-transporting ATPase
MERVFPMSRKVNRVVSPVLGRVAGLPTPGDDVFGSASRFYDRIDGVRELLSDPTTSSVRLVVNPERMVVAEARRTHTYLSLFGYRVDAVVANRLLPDTIDDPWFARWRERHAEQLRSIEEGFAPLPILRADLADDEVVGMEALRRFAEGLYGTQDPSSLLHDGEPIRVESTPSGYELLMELPFAEKHDLDLGRREDELLIRVGGHRRAMVLPDSLRKRQVTGASLDDGVLRVLFEDSGADRSRATTRTGSRGRSRTGTRR